MSKFLAGVYEGIDIAYGLARAAVFIAGAFLLVELAALAAKYAALIQYAMRGPMTF